MSSFLQRGQGIRYVLLILLIGLVGATLMHQTPPVHPPQAAAVRDFSGLAWLEAQ